MNDQTFIILEYDKIKKTLAEMTLSGLGRELVERLKPMTSRAGVEAALLETSEAQALLARGANVPMPGLADIRELIHRAEKGGTLDPHDLIRVADCLRGCRELQRYMAGKRLVAPHLSRYAEGLNSYTGLESEIYDSIEGSRVASSASARLARIRKEIQVTEERIQARLQSFLNSAANRDALQESFISLKAGHYVVPIKVSHRHKVDGHVIDTSGSGMTVFIEPAAVGRLSNELQVLRADEEAEEYQVLVALTGLVAAESAGILANLEIMAAYDFALAKGRLSLSMGGRSVAVNDTGLIHIVQGRHPLISGEAVPLDLTLGRRYHSMVITGPNTGGKTVALKTVGLLTLMIQSGLHVPVEEGSQMAVFRCVLADIGDEQSIQQSLSTFSSHMGRIARILEEAGPGSLVLLDEIGTGTDPAEGAALAMAILEKLHDAGAVTLATTHYSDVKRLADLHPGFINGRMDFDPDTLRPLFRLVMGEAGSSHAFWIAERLGIDPEVLTTARAHLSSRPEQVERAGERKEPEEVEPIVVTAPGAAPVDVVSPDAVPTDAAGAGGDAPLPKKQRPWQIGDSVFVQTLQQQGVVAELPNAKGEVVVFTRGKRVTVNHKRLTLLVEAEHLYPENYDLNVALYTWKDRKLMKDMNRKKVDGQRVIVEGRDE